jgi:hypothetical protein
MQETETRERTESRTGEWLAYAFAAGSVVVRLFPVVYNFAPVGALSLFAGSRMRSWRAYVLPVAVMVVSDLGLNYFKGDRPFDPYVYGSFLLTVVLGQVFLRKLSPLRVGAMAVLSSLVFFVVTNFGCWVAANSQYPHTLAGLVECYALALPFYRAGTLVSDLAFSALFFGVYTLAVRAQRAAAPEEAA